MPLSSGVNASEDEQQDLLRAKTVGQEKSTSFIEDRIKHATISFCGNVVKKLLLHCKTLTIGIQEVVKNTKSFEY